MASRRSNPAHAVSSAAYILFYRRRSSTALGGPRFEQIVKEMEATGEEADFQEDSRNQSPSAAGEGRRLEDSSRGFSSALHEAEAVRQAGNGGLQLVTRGGGPTVEPDDDELPGYQDDGVRQSTEIDMDTFPEPTTNIWGTTNWSSYDAIGQDLSPTNADSGNEDNDDDGMAFSNLHPSTPDPQVSDLEGDTQPITIPINNSLPNWGGEDITNESDVAEINLPEARPE